MQPIVQSASPVSYYPGGTDVAIADGGTGASTAATGFAALAATSIAFTGDITPAELTASVNDYEPTGIGTAAVVRISANAAWTITGIAGGTDGRVLVLQNVGSNDITLAHGTTSTAANQFAFGNSQNVFVQAGSGLVLQYDGTAQRWRTIGNSSTFAGPGAMEAGTTLSAWVAPGHLHRHPGVAKVWVQGTPNSTTIITSYNVASLGDTNTGQQTVTIDTDFSSVNYCVQVTIGDAGTSVAQSATVMSKAAGTYIMNSVIEAGSGDDPSADWNSVGFGDQA